MEELCLEDDWDILRPRGPNHPGYRREDWGTGQLSMGLTPEQIDACYVDQAPHHSAFGERSFASFLTPYGVHCLEERLIQRIQQVGTPEFESQKSVFRRISSCPCIQTVEELERGIIESPHLHPVIKDNLLLNLYNKQNEPDETV